MAEKERCPHCRRPLTTLYRNRREPPPEPNKLGKLRWKPLKELKECEPCAKFYDPESMAEYRPRGG